MAKRSPRAAARDKREADKRAEEERARERTAPTGPPGEPPEPPAGEAPPADEPPEREPEAKTDLAETARRWALPVMAAAAIVLVAVVTIALIASTGGDDDSTEVRTVTEKEPATASAVPVSDEPETSSGFDMAKCLRTEVTVPKGRDGEKTVRKSKEFCEAQDELYGRNVGDDLENTEFQSHHAQDGAVVFGGWIGKTPVEQLRSLYRWSLEDPVVAAMVLGCYSKDTYSQEVISEYRQAKPGSNDHLMAVRAVYTILTNPETSFNNFLLYGKTWNEGVTESGVMTQSAGSFNGEPSTQVHVPPMVLPDGQAIPGGDSKQLHRCINCQRTTTVPGVPVTPEPGVIPPGGGEETPGPGPEPGPETPEGGEEAPGTETTSERPPPQEQPKTDTPSNDRGPTGTGKYQPPSETEPSGDPGSPSGNEPPPPGTTSPHPPPPEGTSPPPGGQAPPAESGGETGCPTCDY